MVSSLAIRSFTRHVVQQLSVTTPEMRLLNGYRILNEAYDTPVFASDVDENTLRTGHARPGDSIHEHEMFSHSSSDESDSQRDSEPGSVEL